MNEIEIDALIDPHQHLRQDDLPEPSKDIMSRIGHYSGRCCDQVVAMPNLKKPPIHDRDRIKFMRNQYQVAVGHHCKVWMTMKWLQHTTPKDIKAAKDEGVIGVKLYPEGSTTNAEDGIPFQNLLDMTQQTQDCIGEMEKLDLILMCHGAAPTYVLDREFRFLGWFQQVAERYPKLRLTLEHISTRDGLEAIRALHKAGRQVLGGLTLHHMRETLDSVIGGLLQPDMFCMPIAQRPEDRDAIALAGLSGESCFAFSSDSAPHDPSTKYCRGGCAGIFTTPVIAQTLVEMFVEYNSLRNLRKFTVDNACNFYGFQHSGRKIVLKKQDNVVPGTAGLVACYRGLETIPWSLQF